jgi:hypothetical protein
MEVDYSKLREAKRRKRGQIPRKVRPPWQLTPPQCKYACDLADLYGADLEHAQKYLDWYVALSKGWIDQATFDKETGL